MIMPISSHEITISIRDEDIDFMGHVNNATYLKWVQDVVIGHWRRVASADLVSAYLWVAVKHEITYRRPAFLDDQLVAVTRLDRVRRESAYYETVIRRGEEVIADVQSRWCCVDAISQAPVRISQDVIACFSPSETI